MTREIRRSLSRVFGLRLLRLAPFERTSFFCDLDSVYIVGSEYLHGQTTSLLSSDDKLIIDLGAHYGILSHKLAWRLTSPARVIAIEACPPNYEVLKKNIALNNLNNISAFNFAVGDHSGNVRMVVDDGVSTHYKAVSETEAYDKALGFSVPCVRLSDLFGILGIEEVDLMKIDIEGSEADVLRDSLSTLAAKVRKLDVEVHRASDVETIARMLWSVGYEITVYRAGILSGSHRIHARRRDKVATVSS